MIQCVFDIGSRRFLDPAKNRASEAIMSELLTVRAAADRLGVGYSTLKQWIYDGSIRTTKTRGGHHRIAEGEIQRALMAQDKKSVISAPSVALGRASAPSAAGVLVALSGRNQLRGIVDEVRVDGLLAQVRLRIGDQFLTAVITRDAVNELKLKRGDEAVAIIKSTEVMIGRLSSDRTKKR
jgi:molybdopterin-binding protein